MIEVTLGISRLKDLKFQGFVGSSLTIHPARLVPKETRD